MRLESGSRLGPYEIFGPIGAGGMGEVYRARDTRLGREVAIKVLPAELTNDRDRLARFEREARSSSALNHRNIVTIHDFTSQDDEAWLVMELIRGESLRDIISRGPLPLKKLLGIASGMADGLSAAHAAGLVHRDLKPENIMVTSDGTAKILDFGLVKNVIPSPEVGEESPTQARGGSLPFASLRVGMTASGVVVGTASYMSPEQARGDEVDFRTDQFSFGVILYEMASGKNPFRRSSAMDTIAAILNDEPPPLDEPLGWIVERCLHKERDERYGSTSDLAHDLRRVRLGPTPLSPRTGKSVRVTPWVLGGIIALMIAMLILRRPPAAPRELVQGSVSAPEVVEVDFGEVAPPIAISPDGRSLLISGRGADDTERLWLHDLASGTTRPLADNVFSAGWSDDGKAIAYFADGKLKTVPREGGPPRTVCDARPEGVPAWSGDTILFTQYSTGPGVPGIYRVSASGGTPIRFVSLDTSGVPWWATFLPDGKHFLYVSNRPLPTGEIHHELMIASLDGGSPKVVAPIDSRVLFADGKLLYVRDGTLLAQPFDVDAGRLTGEAKPIVENLHYFRSTGMAAFTVRPSGHDGWS